MQQLLTGCGLFKNMTDDEKSVCLKQFHYQLKNYIKDEVIVYAQDEVIQQLVLIKGSVKNEMSEYNGRTVKITDMEAPRLLAPGFLFGNTSHYPVSIFANTQCEIMSINKNDFIETILKNNQLQLNFLDLISNQTQFLTRKINFLNLKSIKAKIAHFLLNQYTRQKKKTITLPQSQTQLAELFGVTRPSLSRSMNEFSHDSIISIHGKQVTILNIEQLKTFLS